MINYYLLLVITILLYRYYTIYYSTVSLVILRGPLALLVQRPRAD